MAFVQPRDTKWLPNNVDDECMMYPNNMFYASITHNIPFLFHELR